MNVIKCTKSPIRLLQGDIHVGSAETDYKMVRREVELANLAKAPVWIVGDLFDAIIPRDKRYEPSCYHKRLWGKNDVIGEQIKWALELYDGANIEMVCRGNHDDTIIKHHGFDPVAQFIDLHNMEGTGRGGSYGGYSGYIKCPDLKVYYHHGAGGGSTITAALASCAKKLEFTDGDTDIIWMGHRHWRTYGHVRRVIEKRGKVHYKDVQLVTSGAYLDTMSNEQTSYGERADYRPQGKGGVWLEDGRVVFA